MAITDDRLRELAEQMAAAMGIDSKPALQVHPARRPVPGKRPQLRVVGAADVERGMDPATRDSHFRMIRHHRRSWGPAMQVLIDQACFGLEAMEQLTDDDLMGLLRDIERGIDCIREDVSFEDAGLVRSRYG
ncbi:hypothetical protein MUG10_01095 [Xanthomonas prunicola]|uniref:hypothetical protein n=1 Tax=Xanthomonas prunicola TaxID=2053930 RepID=UPI002078763F|nr:hypothetical protein [Xanthomonas prunicola]USJ00893.1 hypothetical protein MUG10_01095 [Xanthomonas prunicola]